MGRKQSDLPRDIDDLAEFALGFTLDGSSLNPVPEFAASDPLRR